MSDMSGYKPPNQGQNSHKGHKDLKEQAQALGRDLKNKASELTDTVSRTAKDQGAALATAAKGIATEAAGKVGTALDQQKAAGANYIGSIAQAAHRAAGEFDEEVPQAARYIRQAADQLEGVANAVRERDMRELVDEVQNFARKQPTLFFGGAMLLGFAAIRFLKSSSPHQHTSDSDNSAARNGFEARRAHQGA
jgi:hypothetical protein